MQSQASFVDSEILLRSAKVEPTRGSFLLRSAISITIPGNILVSLYANLQGFVPEQSKEIDPSEEDFEKQKTAFLKRLEREPLFLAPYQGRFVASRDGNIVDNDSDLVALTNRFFSQHGDVPVYISKVGESIRVQLDTPFFD